MNCFPCCGPKKSLSMREHDSPPAEPVTTKAPDIKKQKPEEQMAVDIGNIKAHNYTFRELATATKNFRQECLIGEGGFGRLYRGVIPATGQVVAVKQLDRNGMQSSKEFLVEVAELSLLHHENLVNLIGYCADGDQRLLVYELFTGRNLESRLFEKNAGEGPLNWYERMKIVAAASRGLEYLHDTANPPVIFRDLKASNILVDNNLEARLCDFGMAKLSCGDKMNNAPPRLMGTYGYCAPEYVRSGQLTVKSDVYSFGVVLLELITGRRALDTTRPNEEQNLVSWAQPLFRDPKKYPDMADPILNKNFPEKDLNQVVAIASMCLQEEAEARPLISDVVTALSFLSAPPPAAAVTTSTVSKKSRASESQSGSEYGSESESESESESGSEAMSRKGSRRSSVDGNQLPPVVSSKPSRKSSSRSRKETHSADSGDGIVSSSSSSSKSSRKSSHGDSGHKSSKKKLTEVDIIKKMTKKTISEEDVIKKMSKKKSSEAKKLNQKKSSKKTISEEDVIKKMSRKSSEAKDLGKKSSRNSSTKDLSHKSSRKSSARVSSHKSSNAASDDGSISSSCRTSSVASEDGEVYSERSSMSLSPGGISFGVMSSEGAHSDHNSSRRTDDESIHYGSRSSVGSDAGSVHSQ